MKTHFHVRAALLGVILLITPGSLCAADSSPSLKEVFKNRFKVGAALNQRQFSGQDANGAALVKSQFNSVSPENDLKWERIHPRPGTDGFNFGPADRFIEFGEANGMHIVGHTLIWHSQTPNWVFAGTNPPPESANAQQRPRGRRGYTGPRASREELLERMREHIHTVVGRYKGRIHAWDVVNEAVSDGGSEILRDTLWLQIIGPDYIAKAFEYAHEADPDAILRYNDYGLENPSKRQKVIALIKSLQAQNVPVMAIGSQAHVNVTTTFEVMDQTLAELKTLGLPIHITELDVTTAVRGQRNTNADVSGDSSTNQGGQVENAFERQAKTYAALFRAFLKHQDAVQLVTFWGVTDRDSWRRAGTPLLFNGEWQPKPAFKSVVEEAEKLIEPHLK